MISADVIIVGAGIAAHSVACRLADSDKKVIMITKSKKRKLQFNLGSGGGNFRCFGRK